MINTTLTRVKRNAGVIVDSVINSSYGTSVVLSCTICTLAGIVGIYLIASQGHFVSLSIGNAKLQIGGDSEAVI